ncbi:MAG: histidine kinase [Streptosporangiaceae bacterium]
MSDTALTSRTAVRRHHPWPWLRGRLLACARGLAFDGLMLAGAALVIALVLTVAGLVRLGAIGGSHWVLMLALAVPAIPVILLVMRLLAGLTRSLVSRWCGVQIARPYRPPPAGQAGRAGRAGLAQRLGRRARWLLADPATWRDLLWLVADVAVGWVLAVAPALLVTAGLVTTITGIALPHHPDAWHASLLLLLGLSVLAGGLWAAPRLLAVYGRFARLMLGPTRNAELMLRVDHLAQTRSESLDTGAAEMRRIERDLHDGAQARLVAMGMTLDAVEQLMDSSPAAARALLAEARESSAKALAELRDLVRGIHPPVLADRGLAEAIRALAIDLPLRVEFGSDLPGRPPAPVESAAYFAVSELLANASKHAGACRAWIDIRYAGDALQIMVSDDGSGGADPARGTGLRGIERRLAPFDGVLAISSPLGGPTVANMEIPCALSSPKTSSC